MYKAIYKFAMLTSVVVLASSAAACSRSGDNDQSSSITGPSDPEAARGGNGNRPSGGSSSSSNLTVEMYDDQTNNGSPNWNDTITFNVSTTATTVPYVTTACYQNGVKVLSTSAGFFDSYPFPWTRLVLLSTQGWTSGAADCTANLGYYNSKGDFVTLTSRSFHVDP